MSSTTQTIQVKLHKPQLEVAEDSHRFKVICAGRRWGKSVLARMMVLRWAVEEKGLYWIVSPTRVQSKKIHWSDLKKEIPQAWKVKTNETELSIELANGSKISLQGADHPDSLRGVKLRGLVIDEIASIRRWDWLWQEALRPTLTDYEAPALFISTPKGYNHFYDLFERGQGEDEQYQSWRFTSYDNPFIPKKEIDQAKKEMTEDAFYQEYMADFRKHTGLAHKPWERELHLIPPFEVPETWQRIRGFDYGSAHPTASVRAAVDPDGNIFIERSYKDNKRSIKEHAEAIKAQDYGLGHIPCWGDPSGAQWFTEFSQYNLHIIPAIKETGQAKKGWVEHCIERVNEKLKTTPGHTVRVGGEVYENAPGLFVLDTQENKEFVKEIELLRWRETAQGETVARLDESGDPSGGHFDLMAALRYMIVSFKKEIDNSIPEQNDFSKWQI